MKIVCLLLTLLSLSVWAEGPKKVMTPEEFEQQRWNQIKTLIDQEMATINKARKKSIKLQYRMFELKSELIKLYKEKENKQFISLKKKLGKKASRAKIFKKTLALYADAHKYGKNLLRRYPNTRYKAAIYYTLALNSRDFAYDGKQLGYLRKAIDLSNGQSQVNYLARTSLAEYYYNEKQWKSAIYQYDIVLKNQDDEWYTKNLLNYGWCKLKSKKFETAILSLEKSHKLSEDDFYVDVRDQAMTGLINFYVYGKQIDRGIEFIDKNAMDKQKSLLKLAQKASSKGYYDETEKIIQDLDDRINPEKRPELYADLRLFQFEVYKQYHKTDKLLAVTKMFPKVKFNDYQREDAVRKVSELVGAKQIILKKDFSKQDQIYNNEILDEIVTYFDILSAVNPVEKAQYEYFKAETYYSVHEFKPALESYKVSLADYDKTPSQKDLRKLNLDAIFSSIENINFKKKEKAVELEFAYTKYLSYWPKDKKAQEIYPRLYALYSVEKNFEKMQVALDQYAQNFPKDLKKQQDLYRAQIDLLIKEKRTQLLAGKINQMQKGYLSFTKQEVKKSETILANILFNSFQELNKKGETKEALDGYQSVHFTEYYPDSIKAEAAFNMGMIYTDLSDNNNAIKWYQKSFEFYTEKEKNQKRDFLEKMALRTALLHDFIKAARLNKFLLKNFCEEKKKNVKIFTAAIQNDLANDYITKVQFTMNNFKQCISSFPNSLKKEIMTHYFENRHQNTLLDFIDDYKMAALYPQEVSFYYERLYWDYFGNNPGWESKLLYRLKNMNETKAKLLTRTLPKYEKFLEKIKFYKRASIVVKEDEDPNQFAAKLQKRLGNLQPVLDEANSIFEQGHGQISVLVYDALTDLTQSLATEMQGYSLPIDDEEFQKQFKGQMNALVGNFKNQRDNFKLQAQDLIEKYEILAVRRDESHFASDIIKISDIRPRSSEFAITFGLGN